MKVKFYNKIIITVFVIILFCILNASKSNAVTKKGEWDISANDDQSNVTATLYDDGRFIISGTGKIKNFLKSEDREYLEKISEIKNVVVNQGITNIGRYIFYGCNNLETISLPDGIEEIGANSFYECKKLKEMKLPDSTKRIEANAFIHCISLTSFRIPYGVKRIDYNCFYQCSNLERVEIPNTVTEIGNFAFSECGIKNIKLPYGLQKIDIGVFEKCKKLEKIEVPCSVTEIGNYAFNNCNNLNNINIPNSVKKIGRNIFEGCTSIKELKIPKHFSYIGPNAFLNAQIKLTTLNDSEYKNIELPEFIINYLASNPNSYELSNCELNSDNTVRINTKLFGNKIITINDGVLKGFKILISVESLKGHIPEFYGTTNITLRVGDELNLNNSYYRIFAKDYEDGNITKNIQVIKNNVNTSKAGNYEIRYEITDSDNNKIQVLVPVQVLASGERIIQRTLYTLQDVTVLNNSNFTRGNNQDSQDLGIYLPANSTFKIKQLNNLEEKTYLHLFNDDSLKENSFETTIYGMSKDVANDIGDVEYTNEELEKIPQDIIDKNSGTVSKSQMYSVKNIESLVEITEKYSNVTSNVTIQYKPNFKENQVYKNWDKYSGKSYDTIPVIKTLYGVDVKPVIEIILNDDLKPLDYYTYGDNTEDFINMWKTSQNSLAIMEGERTTFLTPIKDLEDLCKTKKDKNILEDNKNKYRYDNFSNIDQILNYYDNIVDTYDNWIGLSDNPSNQYDLDIKSKFFVKANIHGTGGLAYAGWNYTYCTTDTIDSFLHKPGSVWAPFHEFGHGYQGFLKNKELYLTEISNNFFAYYFQKKDIPGEDWLDGEIGDPDKLENMMNAIRNNEILEEGQKSFLEYYPNGNEEEKTGVNRFKSRLFVYINLLNKLDYEKVFPYIYCYCRKLEDEGKKYEMSATDIIAKCFSESSKYNVIPYLESWGLTVSENLKKEIYNKNYPIVYYLKDLVNTDTKISEIKENLNLPYEYSLVSNDDIENYNLKGNVNLSLNTSQLNKLQGSNIVLKSGNEVIKTVSVNNNTIQLSNIPVGTYEIETSKEGYEIEPRYVYITENSTKTLNIESEEIKLEKIEIEELPDNTLNIYKNEELDLTGIKVKAIFSNNTFEYIDNYNVSGFNKETVGTQIITITYNGKTATFSVRVLENNIEGIIVKNSPYKLDYIEGQNFESEGLVVAIVYANGKTEEIENYTLKENENLEASQENVKIEYQIEGRVLSTVQNINVNEKQLSEIKVTRPQDKEIFVEGDDFIFDGMIVVVVYNNGEEKEITNFVIRNGTNLKMQGSEGTVNCSVTIEYSENGITKTVIHRISVIKKRISKIEVIEDTINKIYKIDTDLNLEGGKLLITYNNLETEEIDMTSEKVGTDGYDKSKGGKQTITVTYEGNTTTFEVTVIEKLYVEVKNYEEVEESGTKYIEKILPNTSIEVLKRNIETNGIVEIYKNKEKITDNSSLIGTGMEIVVKLNNEERRYTVVVTGDLIGNGKMGIADLSKLARYAAKIDTDLKGAYLRASDIVKDGKYGRISDISKMARVLAGMDKL